MFALILNSMYTYMICFCFFLISFMDIFFMLAIICHYAILFYSCTFISVKIVQKQLHSTCETQTLIVHDGMFNDARIGTCLKFKNYLFYHIW